MYTSPRAEMCGGFLLGGAMRIAIPIDVGHLRVLARSAGYAYEPDYIEKAAHACVNSDESVLRILYYDCAPFVGKTKLPVSGKPFEFNGSDAWLRRLAAKKLFAVRRGVLKFRGVGCRGRSPEDLRRSQSSN